MAREIIWSHLAVQTYEDNIAYLEKEWTEKEVKKFVAAVQRKIDIIYLHPLSGKRSIKRIGLRQIVVHKRIILFYRFRTHKNKIEIAYFFNTHQKPK